VQLRNGSSSGFMLVLLPKRLLGFDHFISVRMFGRLLIRWVEYGLQRMRPTDSHSYAVLHLARFTSGCTHHLRWMSGDVVHMFQSELLQMGESELGFMHDDVRMGKSVSWRHGG
jgi:hypothetical protein